MHKGQRLFRLNGDEFMIVDFQGGSQKDAIKLYKQIRKEIDTFIEKNQYIYHILVIMLKNVNKNIEKIQ